MYSSITAKSFYINTSVWSNQPSIYKVAARYRRQRNIQDMITFLPSRNLQGCFSLPYKENLIKSIFFLNRIPRKRFCWKWISYSLVKVLCLGKRPWNWSDLEKKKNNRQGLLETTETHVSITLILKGYSLPILENTRFL